MTLFDYWSYKDKLDPNRAIQIADRLWWVGHYEEDDTFQCHVYLLEQGDQSVLFDIGSPMLFRHTLRKIQQVMPLSDIRYFVCHHQDPDVAGAMLQVDKLITRSDAVLVTHWRASVLLKHYGLDIPHWLIEENEWRLELPDRTLKFVFTPYAHFPGAFTTYDEKTGVLLSSDLFGGFTEGFELYAQDESYFEKLLPFHEHYIPSREVLLHALERIEELDLGLIAPQHGSIIPPHLIDYMITRLKQTDCGLYLLADMSTDLKRLSRLNRMLQNLTEALVINRDFADVVSALRTITAEVLPVDRLDFYIRQDDKTLHLGPDNRFQGRLLDNAPDNIASHLEDVRTDPSALHQLAEIKTETGPGLVLSLYREDARRCHALAVITLEERVELSDEVREVMGRISQPVEVALDREGLHRMMEIGRRELFEKAIRDPLTGLFTRLYMEQVLGRQLAAADREGRGGISLLMLDLDYFKSVNDTYGHPAGDEVLRRVSEVILAEVRSADLPVRLGGEEFAVFAGNEDPGPLPERLRAKIAALTFEGVLSERKVTVSIGVATRQPGEPIESLIDRADKALYGAKRGGRDRVCLSAAPPPREA